MTFTIDLPDQDLALLNAKAGEAGISPEEYAREVLRRNLETGGPGPRRHIAQVILDNMRDVPPEVLAQLPPDGANQHDHYIYSLPKRKE